MPKWMLIFTFCCCFSSYFIIFMGYPSLVPKRKPTVSGVHLQLMPGPSTARKTRQMGGLLLAFLLSPPHKNGAPKPKAQTRSSPYSNLRMAQQTVGFLHGSFRGELQRSKPGSVAELSVHAPEGARTRPGEEPKRRLLIWRLAVVCCSVVPLLVGGLLRVGCGLLFVKFLFVVCCCLLGVCCLLAVVWCLLLSFACCVLLPVGVCCLLAVVCCLLLSFVCCVLLPVGRMLLVGGGLLFLIICIFVFCAVACWGCVACWRWFVVCC